MSVMGYMEDQKGNSLRKERGPSAGGTRAGSWGDHSVVKMPAVQAIMRS